MLILRVLSELYGLCMTYVAFICIESLKKNKIVLNLYTLLINGIVFSFSPFPFRWRLV